MNDDRFSGSEGIDGFDKSDDASGPRRFEHLPAWRAAMELVQEVYEATKGKPLEEAGPQFWSRARSRQASVRGTRAG